MGLRVWNFGHHRVGQGLGFRIEGEDFRGDYKVGQKASCVLEALILRIDRQPFVQSRLWHRHILAYEAVPHQVIQAHFLFVTQLRTL